MSEEKIRTIIVDDEKDAVDLLLELLKKYPEVEVVSTACNAEEGYRNILEFHPDLIFLDIRMPRESGLELSVKLTGLPERPAIIFITAYDRVAISAIKNAALDYILKPVNRQELKEAIERFRKYRFQSNVNNKLEQLYARLTRPPKIKFNTRTGFLILDPADIVYCQADGNYTEVITVRGKKETITANLGYVVNNLPKDIFVRAGRSYAVNLNFIIRIDRKTRTCEVGLNGISYTLSLPKKNLSLLEKKLED